MDEIKLKPCPFCGAEAKISKEKQYRANPYYVICINTECDCYAMTQRFATPYLAMKAWNRRANDG